MKFVLFVEGHTEKVALADFLKRWLDPRLSRPVGIKVVRYVGWPELVKDSPTRCRLYLADPEVICVISLLDLYGPTFYPEHITEASERYAWAKVYLESKVGDPRFRQHFAVHETEAWLLSTPTILPSAVRRALPSKVQTPEAVNNDDPPSKLLDRLYWEKTKRTYKKTTDGKALFAALDPNVACEKCPRLRGLLEDMLHMAHDAGL
jgi:hypothetical protein